MSGGVSIQVRTWRAPATVTVVSRAAITAPWRTALPTQRRIRWWFPAPKYWATGME